MKKTYFKKALSLIMAVIMIMSCWVWVAPQKAEAAAGSYTVRLTVNVTNHADGSTGHIQDSYWRITYITDNGTGTQDTIDFDLKNDEVGKFLLTEQDNVSVNFNNIPGFPTAIYVYHDADWQDKVHYTLTKIEIGGTKFSTFWTGEEKIHSGGVGNSEYKKDFGSIPASMYPYADSTTVSWSDTPENVTCPKTASDAAKTQTVKVTAKDQYGVQMFDPTWSISGSNKSDGLSVNPTSSSESTTISVNSSANIAGDTNSQTGTVKATWNTPKSSVKTSVSATKTFTITDATYDVTFTGHKDSSGTEQPDYKTTVQYGVTPSAPASYDYAAGDYDFSFAGWNPSVGQIIADTTYTAVYSKSKQILADYTAVDDAIVDANAKKAEFGNKYENKFTQASRQALEKALNAVVRGLGRTQQSTVDGYAQAINDAIAGLKPNTFDVIFLDRFGAILLYDKGAEFETSVTPPTFPEEQKSYYDAENHYTYAGWDSDEYTSVIDDLVIAPVYNAEAHDWEIETVTSTCVQAGTQKYTCKVCGYVKYDGGDQLGDHVWDSDFTVDLEPTCVNPGSKSIHCSLCDARKDETEIEPKGHLFSTVSSLAPATCDRDGIDTRLCDECGVCEHVLVPASGHDYVKTTVAPTCTAKGYDEYVCQNDGCTSSYRDNYTDTVAHTYGDWETVSDARCGVAGVKKQTCSVCGYVNIGSIDALVHDALDSLAWNVIVAPTCTGTGYQTKTCSKCQNVIASEVTDAIGHNYVVKETVAPTCTAGGYTLKECDRENCGVQLITDKTVATDHAWTTTTHEATCTTSAYIEHVCANDASHNYVEYVNGSNALTHDFKGKETIISAATCLADGEKTVKCTRCDETTTVIIPKLGHNYSAWVKVDATNDNDGSWTHKCANCGNEETLVIPKGGHNLVRDDKKSTAPVCNAKGKEVYYCNAHTDCSVKLEIELDYAQHTVAQRENPAASCTQAGKVEAYCSVCSKVFSSTDTPVKAHSFNAGTVVAPTCTRSGYTKYQCTGCTFSYKEYDESKPATGHDYNGTVKTSATCTADGEIEYVCGNCTESYTETIPATGHSYTLKSSTAADCTDPATEVYECSCGDTYTKFISAATGHIWSDTWETVSEATENRNGVEKRKCTVCDAYEYRTTEPIGDHEFTSEITTPATCTQPGVETFTCSKHTNCAANYTNPVPATGHKQTIVYTAPTCIAKGSTKVICTTCNVQILYEEIAEIAHNYGEGVIIEDNDATCETEGVKTFKCTTDGCIAQRTETIPAKGHDLKTTVTDAKCGEKGSVVTACNRCDYTETTDLAVKGHIWGADPIDSKNATCEEDGYKTYKCQNCNETNTVVVAKLGHDWGKWTVTPSTNNAPGSVSRTCSRGCTESVEIPAGGHELVVDEKNSTASTCKVPGTIVYKCANHNDCGVTLTVEAALKQHTIITEEKDATCKDEGYVKTVCSVCNDIFTNEIREKIAHTYVPSAYVAATCTTSGYTTYTCSCGASYNEYNENDKASGHSLVEGTSTATCTGEGLMTITCKNCTEYNTTVKVPALGHDYVENTAAATGATCAAAATKTYKCSRCEDSYTVSVGEKTTEHSFSAWETKKSATETSIGYKTRTCSVCQLVEFEIINATGEHVFEEISRVNPTCTEKGTINYKCKTHSDCGVTDTAEIPATGHNYLGTETTAPTCETEGTMTYTCQNDKCGNSYTENIPALGHAYGNGVVTPSTCKDEGSIVYACTRENCGGTYTVKLEKNANAHQYATTVVEATCTTAGSVITKCTLCYKVTTEKTLVAKDHYYAGAETEITAPTCTADGKKTVQCKFCDVTKEVAVPKLGHSFGEWIKKDATNDKDGSWTRECSVCHTTETLTIPAGGHNLVKDTENSEAPSCNAKGTDVYYCSAHTNCSVKVTVELGYTQHELEFVTYEATCTKEGTITVKCKNCNKDFGIVKTLPVKAHDFKAQTAVAPTCTTSGYTPYKCDCGYTYNVYDNSKPAKGHDFDETETDNVTISAATCTTDGTKTVKCKNCDVKNVVVLPKTGHTYTTTTKVATCTEAATKTYTCSCGSSYVEFTSEAKGHTFGDWTEIQAPTDKNYGIKKRVCSCGAEELATIAPIGDHNFVGSVTKAPTCTEKGIKTFTCQNHTTCQSYTEEIPALGHSQTLKYTAATCTVPGSTKIVCSVETCKAELASEVIPALGHAWNDGTVTPATCIAEGKIEYTCTRDGCTETKTTTISRDFTAHDYVRTITQPSCTKEGSIIVKCSREGCPSNLINQTLPKTEHTWGTPVVDNATCTGNGSKTYTCTATGCGAEKVEVLEKLGHDWNEWVVTPSTNNAVGSVSRTCKRDANHVESVEIPAGGHKLVVSSKTDASCTAPGSVTYDCETHTGDADCGIELTITLEMTQHNFTTTKKDATCTEEGEVVTKCACGKTYSQVIPATGHTYDDGVKTDAFCTKEGKIVYTCTAENCGDTREVILEKKQHNYVAGTPVAATCTASGYTPYKCASCTSEYVVVTAPANGHSYTEQLSSSADCTNGGTMTLKCACGYTMETTVPALGHDYKLIGTTNATCAAAATETYKCSRCEASYTVSVGSKTTVHDWNDWITVEEPTYTSIGYKTRTCKTCEKLEVMTLAATGDHNLVEVKRDEPTCEADGKIYYECKTHDNCGITDEKVIPKLGHTEELQYLAATCKAEGYAKIYCTTCKKTLDEKSIDKLTHVWGNEKITLSDCTTKGKIEFTCTYNCDEAYSIELPLNENAHTLTTQVTPATCTKEGSSVTTCTKCNKELVKTELPKLQHVWGEWTVTTAATNTTGGVMTRTCNNGCTETVNFPAGGHTFGDKPDSIVPATCTTEGSATYKCTAHTNCGVEITVKLAVVPHTIKTETEDATCTKEGFVKSYCDVCKKEFVNVTTGKIAHIFEVIETVEPDCNTSGYKVYKCKNCAETYNEIAEDALAHNYVEVEGSSTADCVNGGTKTLKCDKCGKEITVTVPALGHTWGEGKVTKAPTCKETGVITFTCTVKDCQGTLTEELPTISHKYKTETTKATCTEDGKVVTICEYCGETTTTVLPKLGHTWATTPESKVDAKCESEGSATYKCTNENCNETNVVTIPALGHVYSAGEKTDPTCTTSGYTVYVCKNDASHTYNVYDASQPAKGHTFGAWKVITNATETTEGLKERTCACGKKETEVIPAMMHNMVEVENVASTCTEKGHITYKCDTKHSGVACTYTLTVELPMIAHTLDTNVTPATCETAGSVVTTCTKCTAVKIETAIPALGHAWNEGKVTTEASCTADGVMAYTCKHDASHTYTKPIEKKQHVFEAGDEVAATCTENGYIPYKCNTCTESYVIITAEAKGHDYLIGESTATCEKAGTITITCKNDKCTEVIVIDVEALGHNWGTGTVTKQPTCTAEGAIEYTCTRCGGQKTDKLDKVDHDYVVTTNDAKCTVDGSVVTTCKHCDYNKTETIKAKGHTWADTPESKVDAKCESEGSATYKCTNEKCNETNVVIIPALGHVYEAGEKVDPTCTTSGYTVYVCKNDASHTYNVYDAAKPAVPHTFSAWAVVTQATQDTDGLERRSCACGTVEKKVIPAMKHNMVVVSTKAATCTAEGEIVYECKTNHDGVVCNYTLTVVTSKIAHTLKTTVTPATCETNGSVVTTCANEGCTAVKETTVLPALGHKYTSVVTKDATCTEDGVMTYTCQNNAEHTYTEAIPAKGHSYTPTLTAPTCETAGYTTYTCACGEKYTADNVPALGHNFGSWKDVNNDEEHQRICSKCNDVETEAHRWDDGKIIVEPSFDNEGQVRYTCGICGATKIVGVSANVDNNAPTGEIKWNATLWNEFLSAITFGIYVNYDVVLDITAEDAETGVKSIEYIISDKALTLEEVKALSDWNAYDSTNKITIPAVDASSVVVYAKLTDNKGNVAYLSTNGIVFDTAAPVISIEADNGNAEADIYCSNVTVVIDDANISHAIYDGKTIALTTNEFFCNEAGTHTVTVFDKAGNSAEVIFTINNGHTWANAPLSDNSNLMSAATCETKAVYYAACSVCGEIDTNTTFEYGNTLGHNYVGTVTTPATCETNGVKTYICQNNSEHTYTEVITATGHSAGAEVQENIVAAKCEKNGSYDIVVYCSVCGDELSRTSHVITATEHDYEGTVTKAPTCTEKGVMTYVCKNDAAHAYSEIIAALGHTDENNDCTCEVCGEKCCKESDLYLDRTETFEPSCTKNGKSVLRCKNCDRVEITEIPALGHKEIVTYYEATCSEYAYKIVKCESCDSLNEKIYTDNAYGKHSIVIIPAKPATCVTDGYTSYERCVLCGQVTEAKTLYKEDVPHIDEDGDGKCDVCDGQFYTDAKTCNCLCHGTGIKGFLYKIAIFFWKLFKMNKSCACGNVHY